MKRQKNKTTRTLNASNLHLNGYIMNNCLQLRNGCLIAQPTTQPALEVQPLATYAWCVAYDIYRGEQGAVSSERMNNEEIPGKFGARPFFSA